MKKPEKVDIRYLINRHKANEMSVGFLCEKIIKDYDLWIAHKLERVLDKSDVEHGVKELIKEVER